MRKARAVRASRAMRSMAPSAKITRGRFAAASGAADSSGGLYDLPFSAALSGGVSSVSHTALPIGVVAAQFAAPPQLR
jgi:hypothetical protein